MNISGNYRKLKKKWNEQAMTGEVKDIENPLFVFSLTSSNLLKNIAAGKLDAVQLALLELESRRESIRTYFCYNKQGRRVKVTIPE